MATEKRLIDANVVLAKQFTAGLSDASGNYYGHADVVFVNEIENAPTVDAVEVPCKIGDFVWAIRNFHGHKHPQRGIVSDMFFTQNMKLVIVVKYVARGEWGETVFATDKEAYAAIGVPCCPNCGAKMDK